MKINVSDNDLIRIYNIRNIESIKFTDLIQSSNNKRIIVPSLLVIYDNGKLLNLCLFDKYFDIFVKKVCEVYNDERENILEDSLTDPFKLNRKIKIDEKTRTLLESGSLNIRNNLYASYDMKCGYTENFIFEVDDVKILLDIVKYHLKDLFSKTDTVLNFDNIIGGYRYSYALEGSINGVNTIFPLIYTKENNKYVFKIGNILSNLKEVVVSINFLNDKIIVNIDADIISYENVYLISSSVIKITSKISLDSKLIHYENKDLKECDNNYSNLLYNTNKVKWFLLPWGAMYGINNVISAISDFDISMQIYNIYLQVLEDSFFRRENFIKSYKRKDTVSLLGQTVVLDEVGITTKGVKLDSKLYLIQTKFDDFKKANGSYKLNVAGKYFYHIAPSDGGKVDSIKKENFINVSFEDDIFVREDMLDSDKILKLVGGK